MNKKNINRLLILVILILFLFSIYFVYLLLNSSTPADKTTNNKEEVGDFTNTKVKIAEFNTDKDNYSSYEEIKLGVNLIAETEIKNAEIRITGIKPYQIAYIKETKVADLPKGESTILFEAQAPSCTSGCGGVYPGPYNISAEIFVEDTLIGSETTKIELVED